MLPEARIGHVPSSAIPHCSYTSVYSLFHSNFPIVSFLLHIFVQSPLSLVPCSIRKMIRTVNLNTSSIFPSISWWCIHTWSSHYYTKIRLVKLSISAQIQIDCDIEICGEEDKEWMKKWRLHLKQLHSEISSSSLSRFRRSRTLQSIRSGSSKGSFIQGNCLLVWEEVDMRRNWK